MFGETRELKAVLYIFGSDEELKKKALPFVDTDSGTINWNKIFDQRIGNGNKTVIKWAHSIWAANSIRQDLIWSSFSLDERLKRVILEALEIRWGLKSVEVTNA